MRFFPLTTASAPLPLGLIVAMGVREPRRDLIAYALARIGWRHKAIGRVIGRERSYVSQMILKTAASVSDLRTHLAIRGASERVEGDSLLSSCHAAEQGVSRVCAPERNGGSVQKRDSVAACRRGRAA